MRNLFFCLLLAIPLAAVSAPMTNDDVIKMVKGGLGKATGVGAVGGAVVGGVLGHAVGGRDHRTAGTVVGAAGGAVAGHLIEKKAREGKVFEISVRFDDGSNRVFTRETHPSWNTGARVKLVNGALTTL